MKKKTGFISFRVETTIIEWLKTREAKTGQNTPDYLRGIMWGLYHQYKQQETTKHVVRKMDAEKLKSLENAINQVSSFLTIPENRRLLAQYLLSIGRTLEQFGLGLENLITSQKGKKHIRKSDKSGKRIHKRKINVEKEVTTK